VNQHLSFYTMTGVRKFDYPPSFSYQEPWWDNYRLLGDYIGRICMALSSGEQINHTLMLQPNTTAWMYFSRRVRNTEIDTIRTGFKNLVYRMEQHRIEYDLGSENVIRTLGSVDGKIFRVGKRDYTLVVIPPDMENLDRSTVDLLRKYMENGGQILSFTQNITRVDGKESTEVAELASRFPGKWQEADSLDQPEALALLALDDFTMTDHTRNGMLYHQRRILDDGQLLFLVNSHASSKASATLSMKGKYVTRFDPMSGEITDYPAEGKDEKVTFHVDLEPAGSALFAVTDQKLSGVNKYTPEPSIRNEVQPTGPVTVKRESENLLVLNYLDLKTPKTDLKEVYFMVAQDSLFREKGIKTGNPWHHRIQYKKNYLDLDSLFREDPGFEVSYHFTVNPSLKDTLLKSVKAVVEQPGLWQINLNGHPLTQSEDQFWIDREFPVFAIGKFLKAGENILTLTAPRMTVQSEVMPVYILGDFLVLPGERGFEIAPGELTTMGSWKEAGLPFYSQKVSYTQPFTVEKPGQVKYKISLTKWSGPLAEVLVNGKPAGLIAWSPYELDITRFLNEGTNNITVRVCGSLKNTFGFFYTKNNGWIFGPGAWNFGPAKLPSASGYFLLDYGMMEAFKVFASPAN